MLDWLKNTDHWILLFALYILYLIVKSVDQLRSSVEAFHEDYRTVNDLDARERMKSHSEI